MDSNEACVVVATGWQENNLNMNEQQLETAGQALYGSFD